MEAWLIALIAILIVHYFCAIFTIWLLLKDKLVAGKQIKKAPLVLWNLLILFVPVAGPAVYLICHFVQKKNAGGAAEPTAGAERETSGAAEQNGDAEPNAAADGQRPKAADGQNPADTNEEK